MRDVVLAMYVSLDGYIEAPGGEWVMPDWSDELDEYWANATVDAAGGLLYGRKCYEEMAQYWRSPTADQRFGARLGDLPKYVASTTLEAAAWRNTTIIAHDFAAEIRKLKDGEGKPLMAFGGAGLAASLITADLVDEYWLLVAPVLFGGGKRLFPEGFARTALALRDVKIMDTGALVARYRRKADLA